MFIYWFIFLSNHYRVSMIIRYKNISNDLIKNVYCQLK